MTTLDPTLAPTLATRYLPAIKPAARDALMIVLGAALVAALAQVTIPLPFTPVPLTGQTFGVLLVGAALGAKRGAASLSLYTVAGALGLPVFAAAKSGLSGPTLGYLFGFIVAASLIGWLSEHRLERSVRTSLIPFALGTLVIYLLGATWLALSLQLSPADALAKGVLPFIPGDLLKMALAALALPAAWRVTR